MKRSSVDLLTWAAVLERLQQPPKEGATGPKGERGLQGDRGPQGEPGPEGKPGLSGRDGIDGLTGPQGPQGERGEPGAEGPRGEQGPQGEAGPRGARGERGDKGPQGDKGDKGPKGDRGPKGDPGLRWRGPFARGERYEPDDAVSFMGSSWVAKFSTAAAPALGSVDWDVLAAKGADGVGGTGGSSDSSGSLSPSDRAKLDAISGTNTGDVTLAAVGSSPSANGASLSGQVLTLQPADATHPGVVTTGTQTIAGAKTFSGDTTVKSLIVPATGTDLVIKVPALTSGRGPMLMDFGEHVFNSETDPVFTWGYNTRWNGTVIQAGEPGLHMAIEGHYNQDGSTRLFEHYVQYTYNDGAASFRPQFFQINKATNRLLTHIIQGNPVNLMDDLGNSAARFYPGELDVDGLAGRDTFVKLYAPTGYNSALILNRNNNSGYVLLGTLNDHGAVLNVNNALRSALV
jgi:hypothetical protein